METLEELDWCLDMLESMQTHRSVADLAKFKVSKDDSTVLVLSNSTSILAVQENAEQRAEPLFRVQSLGQPDIGVSLQHISW